MKHKCRQLLLVSAFIAPSPFAAFAEVAYPLADTGQNACYDIEDEITCPAIGDAFFGQDAQFVGTAQSFVDNEDGSITDNVSSLVWQQDPNDERLGWLAAQDYCAALELAGRDDWRTPNLKELFGISDFSMGWPYLDTSVFMLDGAGKDQQFWSSNFYHVGTTHGGAPSAFGVNHATGHIKAYPAEAGMSGEASGSEAPPPPPDEAEESQPRGAAPNFGKLVRCVAGAEMGLNDFIDVGDGTVLDAATGLMWASAHAGTVMTWEGALAFADQMNTENYLGHNDWRLPDVRELQSIVDYTGVFPALDTNVFETEGADTYFWSSTSAYISPRDTAHYFAWYVAFGYAPGPDGEDIHGAGAVRFGGKSESSPNAEGNGWSLNAVRLVRDAN